MHFHIHLDIFEVFCRGSEAIMLDWLVFFTNEFQNYPVDLLV